MKTIVIILIVAIAVAVLALIGCRPRSPEDMLNRIFKDISNKLNLSEAQTTQLFSIRDEIIEKGREMERDREKMHEELSRLILSDRIDVNEVKAEAKKKHDKMGAFIDFSIDRLAEFHATLTPEQKKSLVELMNKHKRRMKHWHH